MLNHSIFFSLRAQEYNALLKAQVAQHFPELNAQMEAIQATNDNPSIQDSTSNHIPNPSS